MDKTPLVKHYGFAQVPRQVLRGEKYRKKLSLAEKGLYSCLKDICGDTGECYYSLRNLALEIGTSASTLTRLIPALRDTGLIYAEKKVRGTGENKHEIWHIRIVNIWKENDALYKPQDCSILKQSDDISVSNRNNVVNASPSVSNCNNCVSNCNKDCFILLANEYLDSNNNLNEREGVGNGVLATQPLAPETSLIPSLTSLSVEHLSPIDVDKRASSVDNTQLPIATVTTRNASITPDTRRDTEPLHPTLDLEEERARGYWHRLGYIEKAGSAKHWKTLAEHTITFEQFESLFEYTRAQLEKDPQITKKEVNPGNMVREITGWKQEEERKKRLKQPKKQSAIIDPLAKMRAIGSQFISQGVN